MYSVLIERAAEKALAKLSAELNSASSLPSRPSRKIRAHPDAGNSRAARTIGAFGLVIIG